MLIRVDLGVCLANSAHWDKASGLVSNLFPS